MVKVDETQIDDAFTVLEASLVTVYTASAVRAHIAGDLATQKQLDIKTSFNLVKSAATEYGKEYKTLLVDRGGGYVVDKEGKLVFKNWFVQSSKESREKVADIINTGIKEGKGVRETQQDLKKYFNQRKGHAEMIARTETSKVQSIATTNRLLEQGIEHVQWITAEDERVRHSHAERHNKIYKTGTIYTGEFNCRCNIYGYVEEV